MPLSGKIIRGGAGALVHYDVELAIGRFRILADHVGFGRVMYPRFLQKDSVKRSQLSQWPR